MVHCERLAQMMSPGYLEQETIDTTTDMEIFRDAGTAISPNQSEPDDSKRIESMYSQPHLTIPQVRPTGEC